MISNDAQFILNHHYGPFTNYIQIKRGVHKKLTLLNKKPYLVKNMRLIFPAYIKDLFNIQIYHFLSILHPMGEVKGVQVY